MPVPPRKPTIMTLGEAATSVPIWLDVARRIATLFSSTMVILNGNPIESYWKSWSSVWNWSLIKKVSYLKCALKFNWIAPETAIIFHLTNFSERYQAIKVICNYPYQRDGTPKNWVITQKRNLIKLIDFDHLSGLDANRINNNHHAKKNHHDHHYVMMWKVNHI